MSGLLRHILYMFSSMLFIFPKTLINCMYKSVIHNLKPMFATKKKQQKKQTNSVMVSGSHY